MTESLPTSKQVGLNAFPKTFFSIASATVISLSLWVSPSLAKDPFRTTNARPISDRTEAAFRAFFEQGNYPVAEKYLNNADSSDPMTPAMKASLAYIDWQGEKDAQKKADLLEQFRSYSGQTRDVAQALVGKDPLRGNLYLAVSHFLDAGYAILKNGTVKGTPEGLNQVQQAFKYLDTAEAQSPNDPELNLVKGYIELLMALNLPFSSPNQAIDRLSRYARPTYLADRGIALGYRDLNQPAKALEAVDRAIQATPENPELYYLKAQILVKQGNNRDSLPLFNKALDKQNQLPPVLVKQITRERNNTQKRLDNVGK